MKKYKVVLVTDSPELGDGSRKTLQTQVICSCEKLGGAELICSLLRNGPYKALLENYTKNTQAIFLRIEN